MEKSSDGGYAVANPEKTIVIAVKNHNYSDARSFAQAFDPAKDGMELLGQPQEIKGGMYFRSSKRGDGVLVFDTFALFSPHGGGVVIVAITDESRAKTSFDTGWAITSSISFTKPAASAASAQVRSALAGKHLIYLYTGSGYSERMDIILCGSGQAAVSNDMGGFSPTDSDSGSFAADSRRGGTWKISPDGSTLIISLNNGSTLQYTLYARQASNEIGMNGKRFFVKEHNFCR